jgi:hypothetical protein
MVAASLMPFTANPPKNGEEETGPQISQIHADSDSKFQTIDNRVNQREPIIDHRSDPRIVPPSGSRSHDLRESAKSADEHHPARITDAAVGDIRLKVSLTIIARDEETILPSCLESVRGLFDEIVVIDTGSHDRTAEIARSSCSAGSTTSHGSSPGLSASARTDPPAESSRHEALSLRVLYNESLKEQHLCRINSRQCGC